MSIGVDLQIIGMLDKELDSLHQPVVEQTLEGIPQETITYAYPFNVGYLKAVRDMKDRLAEIRKKLRE